MHHPVPKVLCKVVASLDWPVKETTSARFVPPSMKWVNESYGCYTRPKAGLKGVWIGWVNHQELESGIYVSLPLLYGQRLKTALEDGFFMSPFGPHPLIKRIISQKELTRIEKRHGPDAALEKLRVLLKQAYPFNPAKRQKDKMNAGPR